MVDEACPDDRKMGPPTPLMEPRAQHLEEDAAPAPTPAPSPTGPAAKGQRYGKLARRGVAWSFVREGVTELVMLPSALIMARLLTPFDFGVAGSVAIFVTLATRLTNVGFNVALVRHKDLRPEHSSSVFVIVLGLGVAAYTGLVAGAPWIASFFRAPQLTEVVRVAALCFLITPFGSVPAAMMSRDMRFRQTAIVDWISTVTQAGTGIFLAWRGYGYWSLVYGQLAGDVASTVTRLLFADWRPSLHFSVAAVKELLSFGTGVFAKRLLDYGASNLDSLVVGRVLGVAALGFYDKGFTTIRRVLVRMNTGGPMVSFRVLSLISEDTERFRNAYRKVMVATALLSCPMLLGLSALGPDLIPVAYGQRWEPTVVPFQILCVAGMFKVLNEYAGSAVQAMGKIWGQVGRQLIHATLIVVFVAALSPGGLAGAAIGVLLASIFMYLLMQGLLMQLTSINARTILESLFPGVLCGVVVATAVFGIRMLALQYAPGAAQWERLIVEVVTGGVAYLGFIKFNRFREVRQLVRDTAADLAPPFGSVVRLLA